MKLEIRNLTKIFFLLFTFLSAMLIGVGYGIAGKWIVNFFIFSLIVLIYISSKFNWKWGFDIFLISNSILGSVGILIGVPSFLMIAGVATTLACWELSNTEKQFKEMYSHTQSVIYEKNRIRLSLVSIGSGLIIAEIILSVQFQLPFVVIFLLAVIILFCFYQISQLLDLSM